MSEDNAFRVIMANANAIKRGMVSLWNLYERPADHPDGYIARRFEVGGGEPEPNPRNDTLTGKLEALRKTFWAARLLRLTREAADEPQVVESWV